MFAIWMSYGIADCTDGTSNTLAYSEAMVGNGQYNTYYKGNGLMNAGGSMNYYLYDASTFLMLGSSPASNPVLQQLQLCSSQYTPTTVNLGNITPRRGYRWQEGIPGFSMFNVLQVPSDPQYPINYCRTSCNSGCNMDSGFSAPASSWHPGGVNALFADGHVQFVKSSIMRQTWWALGTRGNGEVITANSY
jgi:prepilin-type processing-associated H-X9-DG protein